MKFLSHILKTLILALFTVSVLLACIGCTPKINEEYERERAPLIYRKQQLLREKENLAPNMEMQLGNTSYMSFIFTELSSAIYTDVYPVMSDGGVKLVGVMALSAGELPGLEGKITAAQYNELLSVGWGAALYWNGDVPLEDFILQMQGVLSEADIDFPKSLMFGTDLYTGDCDTLLAEYGIENAVHGGEEDLEIIDNSEPLGVWHPGCIEWRRLGVSTRLKRTVENSGGYALFEVRFSTENTEKNVRASYFPIDGDESDANRPSVFASMVQQFKASVEAGDIEVLNIDGTRAKVERYYSDRRALEAQNLARAEEIDDLIRQVDREITELYIKYH